jgi:putative glycosyltransferase (TIGR04372 family)
MRDASTRGETVGAGGSIRNTTFENYIAAARCITGQSGWVIRMAVPKRSPCPRWRVSSTMLEAPIKMAKMDIHLVRKARMFIVTTSGFAYFASNFGIPPAVVNAISSVGLLWSVDTRFALNPIHTRNGRMLSQREPMSEQWCWAHPTHEILPHAVLTVSENSAAEIIETVKEVFARLRDASRRRVPP